MIIHCECDLKRGSSNLQWSVDKCMMTSLCTVGQKFLKSLVCSQLFKAENPAVRTLGWFYKETYPGASSLILIRGLIYRHYGGSRWDFTGIWVQFYWTVFRSSMKQVMKKISLFLTVSKEYHNTVDHRLKTVSMFTKYVYNCDDSRAFYNTLSR